MNFTDTHCHLYSEEFDTDRSAAVERALEAGVTQMLLPAIDSQNTERQHRLAAEYPSNMHLMAGLHPTSVDENYQAELTLVEQQLALHEHSYVAIGEIGLDLYWDTTYRQQQIVALRHQLQLSKQYHLPVALHIRNAYNEMLEVLKELNYATYNGVFHCFSGDLSQAYAAIEMGFYLGIGGVLTYKKSTLPEVVKAIPIERLLLETDCPYLAPVPYRGKRNESAYIVAVANKIAEIKGLTLESVAFHTTHNAKQCFTLR